MPHSTGGVLNIFRIFILVIFSITALPSYAETPEQIQSGKEISDQTLSIIRQIRSKYQATPSPFEQIDKVVVKPKMFEGAYRASKAVLAVTKSGVTYSDYGNLIQPLLAEASILKDIAITPDEQLLSEAYLDAANIYAAAGRIWSVTIDHNLKTPSSLWPIAEFILTKANDAYLRNYRLELSSSVTPKPQPTVPKKPVAEKEKKQ